MTDSVQSNAKSIITASSLPKIEPDKLPNARDQWILLEKLGEGTYGQVYRVQDRHNSDFLAAKIIRLTSDEFLNELVNEWNILKTISEQNENLPNFSGIFADQDQCTIPRIWFVMELCHLGPMTRLLKQMVKQQLLTRLNQEYLIAYALQSALKALKYLHQSGIMHRDVKGSHILVTDQYRIKLIDFGIAGLFNNERSKRNSSVGTSLWMAPEVVACGHQLDYAYDERCDIWSLGITAIELADGQPPLSDLHSTKVLLEIPRRPPPTVQDVSHWSEDFLHFLSSCLIKDYEVRPNADQLLSEENLVRFDSKVHENFRHLFQRIHQEYLQVSESRKGIESDQSTVMDDDGDDDSKGQRFHRNPWIMNISKSAELIDDENNLAHVTFLDHQRLVESLRRRFMKTLIYTYIGDVLLAINPKQFLPIDNFNFQLKYSKMRRDLLPHVFALATNVYHQMLITHKTQCLILSGESGSGKTHAAQNLISELVLLSLSEQRALENRLVTMNLLLESFGNAQTTLNNNSSRFGKLLEIFFSPLGTIAYVQLSEFLLEKTRVVLASGVQRNFHIFYSIYEYFSRSNPIKSSFASLDPTSIELFRTISSFTYLGDVEEKAMGSSLSFNELFDIFQELEVTEGEQRSILAILMSIIHLGNISFQAKTEQTEPGCEILPLSMVHLECVDHLLKIEQQQLIDSLCQSTLMAHGETVIKFNTIAEAYQTRDAMGKALYSRLFDWIIFALNRYFRHELEYQPKSSIDMRKQSDQEIFQTHHQQHQTNVDKDFSSIAILDLFGFETFERNSYEQLCINIANEQLQYFFRQHTFAWEMKEYENEGIDKNIDRSTLDFPNNRSILDMCLSKPIGLLALLDEESRFPQSTESTLLQKWRQNLHSPLFLVGGSTVNSLSRQSSKRYPSISSADDQFRFTISHYAGQIEYSAVDFLEKNRDFVPMEILDLLLQSDDDLVRLLFQSRIRKNGSAIYTENEKYVQKSVRRRTATSNRSQATVSTYFRYSLMELVSHMASSQPTFIRCLVPNRLPSLISHQTYDHSSYFPQNFTFDRTQFDSNVVLEQIRSNGLLETIEIRRRGYSHRILYDEFVSNYSCLIGFLRERDDSKEICSKILSKVRFTDFALGKTKVFLKFYQYDQLNYARKVFLDKIVRLQSRIRMFLIRKANQSKLSTFVFPSDSEERVTRLQAIVRGFLIRCQVKKKFQAIILIQAFWRMWLERIRYKRRLLQLRQQQIQISSFSQQVQSFGEHFLHRLETLQRPKSKSMDHAKRPLIVLCSYYDALHQDYLKRHERKFTVLEKKASVRRPSTAPSPLNVPQAPPCPPAEFFQQAKMTIPIVKRQKSAPAAVMNHIDELKRLFANRQSRESFSFRPISPPICVRKAEENLSPSSSTHLDINKSLQNDQSRRRLSTSSTIIQARSTGLLTCSTSSLVGDLVLTTDDVKRLKDNLRKTGFNDGNQTLRRKPMETIQVDFRSVLRSSKSTGNFNVN